PHSPHMGRAPGHRQFPTVKASPAPASPPKHRRTNDPSQRPYSTYFIYTECTHGCHPTGAKSSAPRRPAPGRPALRQKPTSTARKSGKRHLSPAGEKCARPPPAPHCGASRAPSSETALTGPVRQRQAPAATRQPPRTARPPAARTEPGHAAPGTGRRPGDRGLPAAPGLGGAKRHRRRRRDRGSALDARRPAPGQSGAGSRGSTRRPQVSPGRQETPGQADGAVMRSQAKVSNPRRRKRTSRYI
ncbi:MAG: hypothetical protein JWM19_62, partial [Actinomycetia bacterium]|nr:hypothetical protein [Actinomycetes bacterium]